MILIVVMFLSVCKPHGSVSIHSVHVTSIALIVKEARTFPNLGGKNLGNKRLLLGFLLGAAILFGGGAALGFIFFTSLAA
jgi:hypothetical protein